MTERLGHAYPRAVSRSDISAVAAGVALGVAVAILWKRSTTHRRVAPQAAPAPAEILWTPAAPVEPDPPTSSIMKSELERLAGVAVSHGPDDLAVDLFLAFVGALDPLPDAATLEPAAQRIGKLRLEEALDRPGPSRLGASRLLAAASAEAPPLDAPPA